MNQLKDSISGQKAPYKTLLTVTKVKNKLIFEFYASYCSFNSYSDKYNDKLWEGDALEVFIETKEKDCYYEFEVAPNGTYFIGHLHNDGKERQLTLLKDEGLETHVSRINDDLLAKFIINTDIFDIPLSPKFNAFRIETDNEKSSKYLMALNPTLSPTFHEPRAFVFLKDYILE